MVEAVGESTRRLTLASWARTSRTGRERRWLVLALLSGVGATLFGGVALGVGLGVVRKLDKAAAIDATALDGHALVAVLVTGLISFAVAAVAAVATFVLGIGLIRRTLDSERRYRALFDNAELGIAVLAAEGEGFVFVTSTPPRNGSPRSAGSNCSASG
ncbi:MAG: hypothetical protein HWD60_07860 [Defluviicoccus sp.]|nr:MAG: hypothetical protein HWD60_07860 [Defluviicoccus sp.]